VQQQIMTSSDLALSAEDFQLQVLDPAMVDLERWIETGQPAPHWRQRWAWNLGWELGKQAATSQWERAW
jgi:hypothetical protein